MFFKTKKQKLSNDEIMKKQWEVMQVRGKKKYIWIDGVVILGIGIPTFIVIIDLLIGDNIYPTIHELTKAYARNILLFSIAGYSYKSYIWRYYEKWSVKQAAEKINRKLDFCYYCGADIENADICPECGKKLMG